MLFSSGPGASSSWTREILALFGFSGQALDVANFLLRKTGHVLYYMALTLLLTATFRASVSRRALFPAVLLALATAVFDETRQSLFASRTGTAWDLIYDLAGIAAASLLILKRNGPS